MTAQFKAVIFDMDGLLLDSELPVKNAWIQACAESGIVLSEAAYIGAIGRNARDSQAHMEIVCGSIFDYSSASSRVAEILKDRFQDAGYPLKDGAIELLAWMRDNRVPLAVASSSSHNEVKSRLHKAGIDSFFTAIAGGDEVTHGKPAPDLYILASERLGGVRPAECLAFEDSEPGAEAALAAGMGVVIVPDLRPPSDAVIKRSLTTLKSLRDAIAQCHAWIEKNGISRDLDIN